MASLLIIGAGGVATVAAQKAARLRDTFQAITVASRRLEPCEELAAKMEGPVGVAQVEANDSAEVEALIRDTGADLVLNLALPYQDLAIMDACLAAGAHYADTANYEPPDEAKFEYSHQWAYRDRFREAGLMGLLGTGFDPGVTSVFVAHALKEHFDEIHQIDILDCNAGEHDRPFATNFNLEINLREITQRGRYYENGEWIETEPLAEKRRFSFPGGIGKKDVYLLYHEELESLARNIPGVRRMRFWMTFSPSYLEHLRVLENVGLTGIEPIPFQGQEVIPIQFLQALLPDPSTLAGEIRGQTCIGCHIQGIKDGVARRYYIYNLCDHEEAWRDVGSQAVSYTTGVPAMVGAKLMLDGTWMRPGVYNVEELDPAPFLAGISENGLPYLEDFEPDALPF